jgi:putative Ca2+/H+ antiporter (TMEM165/GDT1 family)
MVLVAELVGDKSIYTISSLALHFRPAIVFAAVVLAFAGKMLVVVLFGRAIVQLHSRWTDAMSAVALFVSALIIWLEEPEVDPPAMRTAVPWVRAGAISFAALFFTEWGDPGQVAAAALTLHSGAWVPIWVGGTLAMITKGALAIAVGCKLHGRLPRRLIRALASVSCGLLGVAALYGAIFR